MDVKDLSDLPHYFTQMKALGLLTFQYSIRELSTVAQFLAYSQELCKSYTTQAIKRFHIDTRKVIIQTDLGIEFDGDIPSLQARRLSSGLSIVLIFRIAPM